VTAPPLRVLHLTAGSDAGGLSRYILDLGSAMSRDGHSVAVAGERGDWHDLFAASPLAWVDVPMKGGPLALRRSAHALKRWLVDHPVDLLHAHYRRAAFVGLTIQQWVPIPLLYTLHLSDIPMRWPWQWVSHFGDHTHAASVDAVPWLTDVARVPAGRITVIPHGVDPDRFVVPDAATRTVMRAALGFGPADTVAAYVGRLDDPKNVVWLLDVAAALPQLRLVIAGEGPHAAAVRRQAGDNVTVLPGRRDPVPVYHAADALLLPSAREGFSLVTAEAMSCGVPVLRTRTAGTTETIVEGLTGRSTPVDRAAFVSAAVAFLSDRDALRRMGKAAAEHVRRSLTFDRQYRQTVDLYRSMVAASREVVAAFK
jgi:glycosyltransferase involved in cell wall biosynthesis